MHRPARRVSRRTPPRGWRSSNPRCGRQTAYTLGAPRAARKLNQNENPYDLPAEIKSAVLAEVAAALVATLSRIRASCPARAAGRALWMASGRYSGRERVQRADPSHALRCPRPGRRRCGLNAYVLTVPPPHQRARRAVPAGGVRRRLRVRCGRADRRRGPRPRDDRGAQFSEQSHRLRLARGCRDARARGDRCTRHL